MIIKDLKDFTYEKYYRQLGILSILFEEKIGSKIGSKINNNYLTNKNLWNIADIKSVTTEHPKISPSKLPNTIRQAEKVSQVSGADKNSDSFLYSETVKWKTVGWKKWK